MQIKSCIALAASAGVVNAAAHRHAHRHAHQQRDVVFLETDTITETDWVTVTIDGESPTAAPVIFATSASTSSTSTSTSTTATATMAPNTPVVAPVAPSPTTLLTVSSAVVVQKAKPTTSDVAPAPVPTTTAPAAAAPPATTAVAPPAPVTTAAAAPTTTAAPATVSTSAPAPVVATSGNKRGAAYNTASLVTPLLGAKSKLSWAYNWGQVRDTGLDSSLEFVPMLWGNKDGMASGWAKNAATAIAGGSKHLLSVNEPDNSGQSDMSPSTAAAFHQTNMNPFSGKARIGSPAITNSGASDEGVNWLKQFFTACNGNCAVDFCVAHWYAIPSTSYFLSFLQQVGDACQGKPVWLTEFAPSGSDAEISSFLTTVQDQLDNNSTFSFVERYSYFMVSEGSLVQNGAPTDFGKTFAFA